MEIEKPQSFQKKMRGCKLRSSVNWQQALNQTGVRLRGVKKHWYVYKNPEVYRRGNVLANKHK
jgi:hypothetical protein